MRKVRIYFEKIPDPFADGVIGDETTHKIFEDLQGLDFPLGEKEDQEMVIKRGILTQSGILPVNESWNPYDGYYAHTNFVVTPHIESLIVTTTGVESYKALSPYRFKVSFGQMFPNDVTNQQLIIQSVENYFNIIDGLSGS